MGGPMCLVTFIDLEFLLAMCVAFELGYAQDDRVIDETPLTVKVIAATTAILPCSADPKYTEAKSDEYRVVWVNPTHTVVSMQDRRMINDMRITIERPFLTDWNLHIRNVTTEDAGIYKCQINTDPPKTKRISLIIQVPPKLHSFTVPSNIKARIGESIELMCNASGSPTPSIRWYRLNRLTTQRKERVGMEGEILRIHNISQVCADTYVCVANNSVPPSKSRQFKVTVEYPPEITLPNSKIGQQLGKETILECVISSSPLGVTVWKRRGVEIGTSWKYEVDLYNEAENMVTLSLRIAKIEADDYGDYTCEALNPHGRSRAKMRLYEIPSPTTTTTTTSPISPPVYVMGGGGRTNHNDVNKFNGQWKSGMNNNNVLKQSNGRNWEVGGAKGKRPNYRTTPYSPAAHGVVKPNGGAHLTGVFGTGSVSGVSSEQIVCQALCKILLSVAVLLISQMTS